VFRKVAVAWFSRQSANIRVDVISGN